MPSSTVRTIAFGPVSRAFNAGFVALTKAPLVGPLLSRNIAEISYVGKKSGRTITTPIAFSRSGDSVTINVVAPQHKTWWRNFLGDGGPLTVRFADGPRSGHAVAHRDEQGRVKVDVALSPTE
jgi:hypothetical protein